jgi:hypothetical protein
MTMAAVLPHLELQRHHWCCHVSCRYLALDATSASHCSAAAGQWLQMIETLQHLRHMIQGSLQWPCRAQCPLIHCPATERIHVTYLMQCSGPDERTLCKHDQRGPQEALLAGSQEALLAGPREALLAATLEQAASWRLMSQHHQLQSSPWPPSPCQNVEAWAVRHCEWACGAWLRAGHMQSHMAPRPHQSSAGGCGV